MTVVKKPTTPKQEAIVEAILEDPHASNATIADRVADSLGDPDERPSASWVSRIRNEKLAEHADTEDVDDWEGVDYRRMRQVAAVRNIDTGTNPSKPDLADALEADGVPPEAVASIDDESANDADAIDAVVREHTADDGRVTDDDAVDDPDTTEDTDHATDGLDARIDALESAVEEMVVAVGELTEVVERVEAITKNEYADELVAEVLRDRADELTRDV